MEPRYFLYKLVVDNGGAPCVQGGLLSLAICKPMIRTSAVKGDWIFGFGGKRLGERLIYIAKVWKKLDEGAYYREDEYQNRGDCIYRWKDDRLEWREGSKYHEKGSGLLHDVGDGAPYNRATVLVSNEFRYLGVKGTDSYKSDGRFPSIKATVEAMRQGHRVNHPHELADELKALQNAVWEEFPDNIAAKPSDGDTKKSCSDSEGEAEIICPTC